MLRACALLIGTLVPLAAAGAVLYKSVDANGTIMFSDVPPEPGARILEERRLPSGSSGAPVSEPPLSQVSAESLLDYDAAIARANAQVDLAEHALAVARRDLWSPREGLRLSGTRMSGADEQRIEFYKRNVVAARQALMELLRERRLALRQ